MIVVVGLLGLILGTILNQVIAVQLRDDDKVAPPAATPLKWVPLVGALTQRAWLALAVELTMLTMTVVLWQYYGWSLRFGLLLAAVLVLVDTAAIDWQVKLIDTLIMIAATIIAVIAAPWIISSHSISPLQNSLLGLFAAAIVFMLFFIAAKVVYPGQHAPFGLGDVYLGMFIGALVGFFNVGQALFYGILLAGLASLLMIMVLGYKRARLIPISYGSFLCLGVLLHLVLWPISVS